MICMSIFLPAIKLPDHKYLQDGVLHVSSFQDVHNCKKSLVDEQTWRLLTCKKTNLKVYYQGVLWLAKRYSWKSFVVIWSLIGNIILALLLYCNELILENIVLVCQWYWSNGILDLSCIGGIHLENCVLAKTVLISRVNLLRYH